MDKIINYSIDNVLLSRVNYSMSFWM